MKKYLLIFLVLLLGAWLAGCSGSRVNGIDETNAPIVKPEMGDKGAANGWSDPTPGDPYNWRWCNIYGQMYKFGGANIAYNPPGYDPGYYMHFWLSEEACDAGWGLYEAHVMYWTFAPGEKDGIPGKYDYKWVWLEDEDPMYPDMPPCEYYLYIGDYNPATDIYFAIHSVVAMGEWLVNDAGEYYWNETANETGWGANCGGKYGDGTWAWDGNWKKWGGWVSTESTYNLPIFDPVLDKCYEAWHYGPYSYWRIRFTTEGWYPFPGGNDWVGWCTDPRTITASPNIHCVDVYSCYDPDLPAYAASDNWEFIAYLINQRNKGEGIYNVNWSLQANKDHFQNAVWYFKYGPGNSMGAMPTGLGAQFVNDAKANGDNYYPMAGEWYAAILWPEEAVQVNIIEVDP